MVNEQTNLKSSCKSSQEISAVARKLRFKKEKGEGWGGGGSGKNRRWEIRNGLGGGGGGGGGKEGGRRKILLVFNSQTLFKSPFQWGFYFYLIPTGMGVARWDSAYMSTWSKEYGSFIST